jgi:hypothetical protein
VTTETAETLSDVIKINAMVMLTLTLVGLAASIFGFFAGGGFFVLLYFVAAEVMFLVPTLLQYASAQFFEEYIEVMASGI